MNHSTSMRRLLIIALLIAAALPQASSAQEQYFRDLTTAERLAPVVPPLPEEDAKYNMAVGPLRLNAAAGVGIEYNDNINLDPSGSEIGDFIFRPSLELDARWPLTNMNTLRFSLGLSYAKYFNNSEFDTRGVLISPTSILAFTFLVGQVQITLRDQFSYQEDPYGSVPGSDTSTLSDDTVYRRYTNTMGIQADWNVNQALKLTGGYDHFNLWPVDGDFESLENAIDTIYLRPSYAITPTVTVGVNGSASWVRYLNQGPDDPKDANNYMLGAFVDFGLTEYTRFNIEGGWQEFAFQEDSSHVAAGGIVDSSDYSSFYIKAQVKNRLSDAFDQRLAFTKNAELAYQSNFYDLYRVDYSASWNIMKDLSLNPNCYYEHYKTSGGDPEKADLFGAGLGLRYVLTSSVTLGLDYRFSYKDSNFPDSDYDQNLVYLSLYYKF